MWLWAHGVGWRAKLAALPGRPWVIGAGPSRPGQECVGCGLSPGLAHSSSQPKGLVALRPRNHGTKLGWWQPGAALPLLPSEGGPHSGVCT